MRQANIVAALVLVCASLAPDVAHGATTCAANVMVLLDRSTSMTCDLIGGQTRWQIATSALNGAVTTYETKANFGLTVFPAPGSTSRNSCDDSLANDPVVPLESGSGVAADFSAAEKSFPSGFGMYTPIGQTLDKVLGMPGMNDTTHPRYVILITDGAENCRDSDKAQSSGTMVATVNDLRSHGITTFVVGFSEENVTINTGIGCTSGSVDGIDALLLNKVAVAGGAAPAGCDATSSDSTNPSNCYLMATDQASLNAALSAIGGTITQETCDGVDNNCNGDIDEGLTRPCTSTCGTGTEHCDLGSWVGCTAPQPVTDMCTGGLTCDPPTVCPCQDGDTMPCGSDVGECTPGTQTCTNGVWGECMGGTGPTTKSECDGLDHNCNGMIDDGNCQCAPGQTMACDGPNTAPCKAGTKTCKSDGTWGPCLGVVGPTPEKCDNIDNNCDGTVDEGLTRDCSSLCGTGTEHCEKGQWVGCTATAPQTNTCTGEQTCTTPPTSCGCTNGDTMPCGPPAKGECKPGTQTCVDHVWGACTGGTGPSGQSECDGKDHNCDGVVDKEGCECAPGATEKCGGPDVGQCKSGTRTCSPGGAWGDCVGAVGPSPETCDGLDNDCDGVVDNPSVSDKDDVPHSLCGGGQVCQNGACVTPPPEVMPIVAGDGDVTGEASGCACAMGGDSRLPVGDLVLAAATALLVVFGRRRRR